ncbi:LysR family transcriptional regulator [Vibrio breoganii]|uniref:LysR family transcriptional regulator n=1 Tax=Vibrio breoganii TaxID=553239 RepID=UPI0021C45C4E|nr:LysR family transcriptional regulator [Vibrio breoganii]MDN3715452.1 LysR family transcriptional regulator [Vibrio breoganii]
MFSYEHLAAFCATVDHGSYSQAAKHLGKDRTTVREQVKALEDSYAVTLFDIQGKKAVPSAEGEAIYKQAKLLVNNSDKLNARMMDSYKTQFTSFNFYHDILAPHTLILHIEQYMQEHFPHITINWLHRNRQEILNEVATEKNAVAIMQHKLQSNTEDAYQYLHLGSDKVSVYCRPDHPLTKVKHLTIEDLQLSKQYVSENHIHSLPEVFSVSSMQHTVSNNDVLLNLLVHDGWAFCSNALAQPLVNAGKLVEIMPVESPSPIKIGLSFYFPISMKNSPELNGLQRVVREYAKKHFV